MVSAWNTWKTVLFLLSFWGYFFSVYRLGKVKIWFVPLTCICGISLFLFWGGLLDLLPEAAYILMGGGLAGCLIFLVYLFRGKVKRPHITAAGLCLGGGMAVFLLLAVRLRFTHYDNFSHWAVIVKYLILAEHFPGADTVMVPFRDYPPGVSLFVYYFCKFCGHSQGMMLLAQNSILLSCFLAVFGVVKEPRRFLLYSFLGMGCSMLSYLNLTIRINNLLVDFLLPLLAMASMAVSYRCKGRPGQLCFLQILILGFTGIVKETGVFFAGTAALFAVFETVSGRSRKEDTGKKEDSEKEISEKEKSEKEDSEKEKREEKSRLPRSICALLLAAGTVLPVLGWQYHLETDLAGFEGKFNITGEDAGGSVSESEAPEQEKTDAFSEEHGKPVSEELRGQVIRNFVYTALDLSGRAAQSILFCTVIAAAAILFSAWKMKRRWKLGRVMSAGIIMLLLYYAGMLWMYLYVMPEQEALRLAGFERYASSAAVFFCGILIMAAVPDIERSFAVGIDERGAYRAYSSPAAKRRYQYAVLASMLLGVNFLYSEYNGLVSIREEYGDSLPGRVERITGDCWYEGAAADERSYLVFALDDDGQVSSGEVRYVFRYFLWAPDVEVRESTGQEILEETDHRYDFVILLDRE